MVQNVAHLASDPDGPLRFETLISDTSAALMTATPDGVDAAIQAALDQTRTFFGADRCGLLSVSPDNRLVHLYRVSYADGVAHVPADINFLEIFPWAGSLLLHQRVPAVFARLSELPPEAAADRAAWDAMGTRANFAVPIVAGTTVTHLIVLHAVHEDRDWPVMFTPRLRVLGELMAGAIQRRTAFESQREREEALKRAHEELHRLRERLEEENVYLRKAVASDGGGELIAGRSPAILRAVDLAAQVAQTSSTVLLVGETGTGKERFAEFIHRSSPRRNRHMVRVNCSAIPSALIESELFGRERGAYTGALSKQIGRFELAQDSTLFLDEIGDLPMEVQVKLLRVLQERTIERLGSPTPIAVDVRIIAATNRDLDASVRAGTFRADLYYRLNVFPIVVPPLRERREDIPQMVEVLVDELGDTMRKRFDAVERASLDELQNYDWPGNVRELRNVLERAMILATGPTLRVVAPRPVSAPEPATHPGTPGRQLKELEREHILRVLTEAGWRVRGSGAAAEILGVKPTSLEARMARLGIRRPTRGPQ